MEPLNAEELEFFLELVELAVLPSEELKRFFQSNPLSSPLAANQIPPVKSAIARMVLRQVVLPLIADHGAIGPEHMDRISQTIGVTWENGLGAIIQQANCQWRDGYVECIRKIVDRRFFGANGKPKQGHCMTRAILELTVIDNPCRYGAYDALKDVLLDLVNSPIRAAAPEPGLLSGKKNDLSGGRIREFFSHKEEAMILMVVRKRLVQRLQGSKVLAGYWPADPHYDVLGDNVLQPQDVHYYRGLAKKFRIEAEEIEPDSFMAQKHGAVSLLPPASRNKRIRLSSDNPHQYAHGQLGVVGWVHPGRV